MRALQFILEVTKSYKKYIYGLLGVTLLHAAVGNINPYLIKLLIDTPSKISTSWGLLVIYCFLQFTNAYAWKIADTCALHLTSNLRETILFRLIKDIKHNSYTFFQNNLVGNLVSKINDIFSLTPSLIFSAIMEFIYFILLAIITLFLLFRVHPVFALILFTWICIFLSIAYFNLKKAAPLTKNSTEARSKIAGYLSDYITNILNIKLFSRFSFEKHNLKSLTEDFIRKSQKQSLFLSNFYFKQGIVSALYSTFFLTFLIILHQKEKITTGDFSLVFMLNFYIIQQLYTLSHPLREFSINYTTIDQHLAFFEQNKPIFNESPPTHPPLNVTQGEIIFDNVKFSYNENGSLFKNFSVKIHSKEKVGLVGYSGSGKTSFTNLILRLYEAQAGKIFIDGQNIQEISLASLHENISVISQEPSLFHRTIRENISYGQIHATEEEIIDAAVKAHAHEFISQLPKGYDSLVGERGVKLSGGQRQRIAIARAILKNAPILILDEATSQLDSITEGYIQDALWALIKNKTTIIIAHRLSTLLYMDRILVFLHGQIIEEGSHQELLAQNGVYKTLWEAQKDGFLPI
jgi:ATP-binding cassette subfamily B protein